MTYEEFASALAARPAEISPLRYVASMTSRPPEAAEWLLRWMDDQWKDERTEAAAVRMMLELGVSASETAEMLSDARRRRE